MIHSIARTRAAALVASAALATSLLAAPAAFAEPTSDSGISVSEIRTNETLNPLGIDDPEPALSWKLDATARAVTQSAYEVLVASTPEMLAADKGDVWDSGKVESSQSVQVDYGGLPLAAATRYHWKVRVWDQAGAVSDWSAPAWWETALLDAADWHGAQWITPESEKVVYDDFVVQTDFRLWVKAGGVVFRAQDTANMNMWQVNQEFGTPLLRQHIWRGGRVVANRETPIPASVMAAGEAQGTKHTLRIKAEGSTYTTWIDDVLIDEWTVTDDLLNRSGVIGFRGGDNRPGNEHSSAWGDVTVRSLGGDLLWSDDFDGRESSAYFPGAILENGWLMRRNNEVTLAVPPGAVAPLLRTEFSVDKPVASARVYAYGLGFYELSVNGEKADDRVLAPSATPYDDRSIYQTYDVTDQITTGDNAVGLWLAEGYGSSYSEWGWRWTGPRQAIASIQITHTDGTTTTIGTDPATWRSHASPVTAAGLYAGESYDARLELAGWDRPGFDDTSWGATARADAPNDQLLADEMPPIRVVTTFEPISVDEVEPGRFIYDFGQNMAGWTQLRSLDAPEGTVVTIRHAERVDEDGRLDTHTNRNAAATDRYTAAGSGDETWEPRFTYHGFRYAEVTGVTKAPTLVGRSIHADLEFTADFDSSDPLLNKIFLNNRWTILNNFMSFPTDTPVRDERTPPQMDVQAHQDAAIRTLNMSSYFRKYLEDLPGARQGRTYAGDTTMFGIHIPLALALYEEYGDRQVLEEQWPDVQKRADWLLANHPTGVWPFTNGQHGDEGRFGDWCAPIPPERANGGLGDWNAGECFSEPNIVTSVLQFRHISEASRIAEILGDEASAQRYATAADTIADAVNAAYLNADGSYGSGRQTTSILPIVFGMVPEDRWDQVAAYFIDRVERVNDGHLDTGIFGTRYLIDALTAVGRTDLAFGTMTKTTYPSFGYQILEHDATTAWEGWTLRSGMQTYDHAMFIGPNSSFLTEFAGIRSTEAGYEQLRIAPQIPAGLERLSASIDTVRGEVSSTWKQTATSLALDVTVPVNATAEVVVPKSEGRRVIAPEGVQLVAEADTSATYRVGSGSYRFETVDALQVDAVATSRCIAGKVVLTVTVTNPNDAPVDVEIVTPYGTRSFVSVAPAKNAFHGFTTRLTTLPEGTVTVKARNTGDAGSGVEIPVPVAARSCS